MVTASSGSTIGRVPIACLTEGSMKILLLLISLWDLQLIYTPPDTMYKRVGI